MAVIVLAALWPRPGTAGLVELARAGRWETILGVARARSRQLPLRPDEALVVAAAAHRLGERDLLLDALARAADDSGELGAVARVELGELVVGEQPERAADLMQSVLSSGGTPRVRDAALAVVEAAAPRLDEARRAELRRAGSLLPTTSRRRLELALAVPGDPRTPRRLRRLLEAETGDRTALEATTRLLATGMLDTHTLWPAAQALYRHALYSSAIPVLEAVERRRPVGAPRWRVAFLRGRCAFRVDRWEEAAAWYRRALTRCRRRSDRADLEVHLARALELGGDLDGALRAARRARSARDSDGRRLFQLRLLLRLHRADEAERVQAGVRHRDDRDRGEVLLALDDLRQARAGSARRRLEGVCDPAWRGPARVLAAELALAGDDPKGAVRLLEEAAGVELDDFWSARARALAAALPAPLLETWRARVLREMAVASGAAVDELKARWARLEPALRRLPSRAVDAAAGVQPGSPAFPPGLAQNLWRLGLREEAARWDPDGFPANDAALWSAARLLELGETRRAIRLAESARGRGWPGYPGAALPPELQRLLYPLPESWRTAVQELAGDRGVPWQLLAGLVREESRWDATALSRVGARGLTQLMPATASLATASVGQPAPDPEDLFRPTVALRLGSIELSRLLAGFGRRWAPAVAAYNAGEAQTRLWLAECGPGCTDERFLLTVSFSATRGYAARVLASAAMYALVEPGPVTERSGSLPASPAPAPASPRSPG